MQELQITSSCDMTYAVTEKRVPSEETLFLAVGPDPQHLKVVQLDLSGEWARTFHDDVDPYIEAGHEPGAVVTPGAGLPGRTRANDVNVRQYMASMRAWCDETGFKPGYHKLEKGGFYYPRALKAAYAGHLTSMASGQVAP